MNNQTSSENNFYIFASAGDALMEKGDYDQAERLLTCGLTRIDRQIAKMKEERQAILDRLTRLLARQSSESQKHTSGEAKIIPLDEAS